ncbi:MAG TPA: MauE/DoxX family redox-associated membrane protein [Streptosporangiaceae bacterium]|nr:MauE/DoxX family redox-associated membrane protein [Streptosporangiaceae bacterium]
MWLAVDLVTRLVIGGSLLLAGLTKLVSTVAWRQLWLASYRLLPRRLVRPVALTLPTAETGCGLAMLLGVLGAASALTSAVLLVALAVAVGSALARQLEISCHCLTMVGELISWRGVTRNLVLAAAAAVVSWHGGADLLGATRIGWPGQLGWLLAAVIAAQGGTLALRALRRRRTLAAIARRPALPAPGTAG